MRQKVANIDGTLTAIGRRVIEPDLADELYRVASSTRSMPMHLRPQAWQTYGSLIRDRVDRSIAELLSVAIADGNTELLRACDLLCEAIAAERKESDAAPWPYINNTD